jgi:3-oxoacyl-[acyl-carrier-protein] synthase II
VSEIKTVITAYDLVTAYGWGAQASWDGILSGISAIGNVERFSTDLFQSSKAATVAGLKYFGEVSLVMQMVIPLIKRNKALLPHDAFLVLASTVGEIDILEKQVLEGTGDGTESKLSFLAEKIKALTGIKGESVIISCACASSSVALGFAASQIQSGKHDCALVVATDAVTEFVFSGFSSLMALDPDTSRPFDKSRAGLSLGEASALVLLMSEERAQREDRRILGEVAGWAVTGDAHHMTGPLRDGSGLATATQKALKRAGISSDSIGCISGHGTGTVYNDSMEIKAYRSIFGYGLRPLYSIKGAIGHTLGVAGLIDTIIALRVLEEKIVPPTVGLKEPDPEAKDWVSPKIRALESNVILVNNAGFGGVNSALVLKK